MSVSIFDKVDWLVAYLRTAGVKADTDATKLSLPAVWVAPLEYRDNVTLSGDRWRCSLVLIAADRAHDQSRSQLDTLWQAVSAVIEPDSPVQLRTVSVTAGGLPMPALIFEVDVDDAPVSAS